METSRPLGLGLFDFNLGKTLRLGLGFRLCLDLGLELAFFGHGLGALRLGRGLDFLLRRDPGLGLGGRHRGGPLQILIRSRLGRRLRRGYGLSLGLFRARDLSGAFLCLPGVFGLARQLVGRQRPGGLVAGSRPVGLPDQRLDLVERHGGRLSGLARRLWSS